QDRRRDGQRPRRSRAVPRTAELLVLCRRRHRDRRGAHVGEREDVDLAEGDHEGFGDAGPAQRGRHAEMDASHRRNRWLWSRASGVATRNRILRIAMSEERTHHVTVRLKKGYEFVAEFPDVKDASTLVFDEPEPLGKNKAPNAAAVLSAAVGNCLAASLAFCL